MVKQKRFKTEVRKEEIVVVALELAVTVGGYTKVTRKAVADAMGLTPPAISHHFGTMAKLQRAMMRAAVTGEVLAVIAQGLVANDPHAKKAPEGLKRQAIEAAL